MVKATDFRKIAGKIKPSEYTDYRLYLEKVYLTIKGVAASYSYIKFTEDLGLGSSNLMYHHINASRTTTIKTARRIASGIGLKGRERAYFIKLVEYQGMRETGDRNQAFKRLIEIKSECLPDERDRKSINLFSQWYHATILELLRFEDCKDCPEWLSQHLRPPIAVAKVKESLELLVNMELVAYDESRGRLYPTQNNFRTGSEVQRIVSITYHNQMINLALKAISSVKAKDRDISAVSIGVPKNSMDQVKKLTAEFRQKLLALGEEKNIKDEIVQVNIQAFPVSKQIIAEKKHDRGEDS